MFPLGYKWVLYRNATLSPRPMEPAEVPCWGDNAHHSPERPRHRARLMDGVVGLVGHALWGQAVEIRHVSHTLGSFSLLTSFPRGSLRQGADRHIPGLCLSS